MERCNYSVWVGGIEVTDYMLTSEQADIVASGYKRDGYTDVVITLN